MISMFDISGAFAPTATSPVSPAPTPRTQTDLLLGLYSQGEPPGSATRD